MNHQLNASVTHFNYSEEATTTGKKCAWRFPSLTACQIGYPADPDGDVRRYGGKLLLVGLKHSSHLRSTSQPADTV